MKSTATNVKVSGRVAPCTIIESGQFHGAEDRLNHIAPATGSKAEARGLMPANQPQSVGAGEDVAALTLDERGMICDCNCSSETLFKYRRSEMVWRHVSMLLPQLAELEVMQNHQPNTHLRFLSRIGRHFQAVTQDGAPFASELFLNLLDSTGHGRLSLIVRPVGNRVAADGLRRASGDRDARE